jgi:hypothetical protein
MGAILERHILNFAMLVLVDIPLEFTDIVKLWKSAPDVDEHVQIAALDLDEAALHSLARTGKWCEEEGRRPEYVNEIPEDLREKIVPCDAETFRANDKWGLHPTSLARATVALWVRELEDAESDLD